MTSIYDSGAWLRELTDLADHREKVADARRTTETLVSSEVDADAELERLRELQANPAAAYGGDTA